MELINTNNEVIPFQFGEFWIQSKNSLKISRVDIEAVCSDLGFRLFNNQLYRIIGIVIFPVTERDFQDTLKDYIKTADKDIQNALIAFLEKHTRFTIASLPKIDRSQFLNDTRTSCYKFFKNGYIQITPIEIFYKDYDKDFPKDKYILSTKVKQREYHLKETGKYSEFLQLATNWTEQANYIKTVIGYLCHEYKDETTGYIVVLTEVCADPLDGGGSGKNIFCNLLSQSTSVHTVNGSQVSYDSDFFQSWNHERVMVISDVPKNFSYEFLKEPATGSFILKKLYENKIEIPVEDGPKFIIPTNYSYENTDGGLKRRIIPIEFTDFFTKAGGVDVYFNGCHFPTGWSTEDWYNYDTIIIDSIQTWLCSSMKLSAATLTETGWAKQFENSYKSNLTEFIIDNFDKWVENVITPSRDIQAELTRMYQDNDVAKQYRSNPKRVAQAIREYCNHKNYNCIVGSPENILNVTTKCYKITPKT